MGWGPFESGAGMGEGNVCMRGSMEGGGGDEGNVRGSCTVSETKDVTSATEDPVSPSNI